MLKLQCGGEPRREVLLCLDLRVRGMEHASLSTLGFERRPDCLRDQAGCPDPKLAAGFRKEVWISL